MQRQPAWRGKDDVAKLRRLLGVGGAHSATPACLTEAIGLLDWIPIFEQPDVASVRAPHAQVVRALEAKLP
jgi:hypothetical protein